MGRKVFSDGHVVVIHETGSESVLMCAGTLQLKGDAMWGPPQLNAYRHTMTERGTLCEALPRACSRSPCGSGRAYWGRAPAAAPAPPQACCRAPSSDGKQRLNAVCHIWASSAESNRCQHRFQLAAPHLGLGNRRILGPLDVARCVNPHTLILNPHFLS